MLIYVLSVTAFVTAEFVTATAEFPSWIKDHLAHRNQLPVKQAHTIS